MKSITNIISLGFSFLMLNACNSNSKTNKMDIKVPIAEKIPHELKIH